MMTHENYYHTQYTQTRKRHTKGANKEKRKSSSRNGLCAFRANQHVGRVASLMIFSVFACVENQKTFKIS